METTVETGRQIAQYLLEIKAVVLKPQDPFTWASGWKSPIYCDNRLILSYPQIRSYVADAFCQIIKDKYPDVEAISGVATGGIAQAAMVAERLDLPMTYVRSGKKSHGRQNQVEGVVNPGQRVVVIEDLISTGGSSLQAIDALQEKGADVQGLLAIFSYGFQQSVDAFANAKIPFDSLTSYPVLSAEAAERGYISPKDADTLAAWQKAPSEWQG